MRGSRPLALALLVLAVIFALAAIFYFTQKTNFLASGRPAIALEARDRLHRAHAARRGRGELRAAEVAQVA